MKFLCLIKNTIINHINACEQDIENLMNNIDFFNGKLKITQDIQ